VLFVSGATKAIHWLVKKIDELQKYDKERDNADSELIRLLSGIIEKNNITNELILSNQKEILNNQKVIMMKLDKLR
jgi:hypothetical protein